MTPRTGSEYSSTACGGTYRLCSMSTSTTFGGISARIRWMRPDSIPSRRPWPPRSVFKQASRFSGWWDAKRQARDPVDRKASN